MKNSDAVNRLVSHELKRILGAKNRLILLDFDGTLVGYSRNYKNIPISGELKNLLTEVKSSRGLKLIIITGRSRSSIDALLGELELDIVAEHGYFLKKNGIWKPVADIPSDWKRLVLPVMNKYYRKTPGSSIEVKETSLVWHFRNVAEEVWQRHIKNMSEELSETAKDQNLRILNGNMVFEIVNNNVNKGTAAEYLTAGNEYDYVMAIGDDTTDEDMFKAVSRNAQNCTVKIGPGESCAGFCLENFREVRRLLTLLLNLTL